MDVLTDVLRGVRYANQIYGRFELSAPWGMRVPSPGRLSFYAVSRGTCVLEADKKRFDLGTGDLVLLRAGLSHTIKDHARSRTVSAEEIYAQRGGRCGGLVRYGGDGAPTSIVVGAFCFERSSFDPVLASLPPVLHVPSDDGMTARWLDSTLQFMASEMHAEEPGYELVASRLADVLFVHALRALVRTTPCTSAAWLRALGDPELGIVFQRMHAKPGDPWTVESLARTASMSRSAFASRFKEVLGLAPLAYLTQVRMRRATELLATTSATMTEVANAVGYDTDGAFVKTFKRHVGETPGVYRRRTRPQPRRASVGWAGVSSDATAFRSAETDAERR